MVSKGFHKKQFDTGTLLKLAIFRGYISQWLPVFLSRFIKPRVCIYDFFAGPGGDLDGRPGSPIIIKDEVSKYLNNDNRCKASGVSVNIYFNDNHI